MNALIEAREVTKVLSGIVPVTLVQDINLAIMPREFVAITGPSGSGKSSLLYLLGLLDLPTAGDVSDRWAVDDPHDGGRTSGSAAYPHRVRLPVSLSAS